MIRIERIVKAYGDKILLNQMSYHFPEGERIALVGPNGEGKTTLLNIMSGFDHADEGTIIKPKNLRLAVLPQSFNEKPESSVLEECLSGHHELWHLYHLIKDLLKNMELNFKDQDYEAYEKALEKYTSLDGYSLEGVCIKILEGLGFDAEQIYNSPLSLSGGWRMRLELARTLVCNPNFLILDEPTNHLDLPAIEWLEEFLMGFKGTVLFVTHDRALLDRLPTMTLILEKGKMNSFVGTYEMALEQREQDKTTQSATVKKLQAKKVAMQRFVDRFGAKATKAAQASSRKKMISKIDQELKEMPQENKISKMIIPKLDYPKSPKVVLTLEDASIGYTKALRKNLNLTLLRGEKWAIVGKNGLGKSTLLKTIFGELPLLLGTKQIFENVHIGFFRQDAAEQLKTQNSIWTVMKEQVPDLSEQQARGMLGAFLFKGQDIEKRTNILSGGERSRLALCMLLAKRPNLLLLDEPTNHLDLQSKEVLKQALKTYPGSLIAVSHDRDFIESIADHLWDLEKV